jgi:histone H3/H4
MATDAINQTRVFTEASVRRAVRAIGNAGVSSSAAKNIRDLDGKLL